MKPAAQHLLTACLATILAGGHQVVIAAEGGVAAQDLAQVRASGQVVAAWSRQPDSYTLQVGLEHSRPRKKMPPPSLADSQSAEDRTQQFVANTIANLRGLEFPCDRFPVKFDEAGDKERRVEVWLLRADGTQILPTAYGCAADVFRAREPVADRDPEETAARLLGIRAREPVPQVTISYRYALASGAQAVAAIVRIDDEYCFEELHPLEPKPLL